MKHLATKSEKKFQKVMHEFGQGELLSHGQKVTNPKQAIAIAFSEARKVYPNYGMKKDGGQAKSVAVKGSFYLDAIEGKEFYGYTFMDDWNGFQVPYFERPQANRIMEALEGTYKDGKYLFDDGFGGEEGYEKQTIDTVDGPKDVYAIGAYNWTWSSPEKIKFVVIDENTLAYINPDSPDRAYPLQVSVIKGGTGSEGNPIYLEDKKVRPATAKDFDEYRVSLEGYAKDSRYESVMKNGGGIPPTKAAELAQIYSKGSAKQLWEAWSTDNRIHFLMDHATEYFELMGDDFYKSSQGFAALTYDTLPSPIRKSVIIHHAQGMYGNGGGISRFWDATKRHSKTAYEKSKELAGKGYEKTKAGYRQAKAYTEQKIHDKKKNIALDVLDETRGKVDSRQDSRLLNEAFNLVEDQYADGGEIKKLIGTEFRPFNTNKPEKFVSIVDIDFDNVTYEYINGDRTTSNTKDFFDTYIQVKNSSGSMANGGEVRIATISDFKEGNTLIDSEGYGWHILRKYDKGIWEARGSEGQGDKVLFEGEARFYKVKDSGSLANGGGVGKEKIRKEFESMKKAENYRNSLYSKYNQVSLIDFPRFSEKGIYVFEVSDKMAEGGGTEDPYYIFEGFDHRKQMPLYQVIGRDNDYVGEWHTNSADAEKELQDLNKRSMAKKVYLEKPFENWEAGYYDLVKQDKDFYIIKREDADVVATESGIDDKGGEYKYDWIKLSKDRFRKSGSMAGGGEIKEDIFYSQYKPQINHIVRESTPKSVADEDIVSFSGTMYETYGPELAYISKMAKDPKTQKRVWTIIEGEDGEMHIVAGFKLVNRQGYIITEKPWKTGHEEIVEDYANGGSIKSPGGRGFFGLEKGKEVKSSADVSVGDILLSHSDQFNADNTIKVTDKRQYGTNIHLSGIYWNPITNKRIGDEDLGIDPELHPGEYYWPKSKPMNKLSPAKQKLLERINTLKEAKANAGEAAQKAIQKKIDKLKQQFDYNPSAKEKAMDNKGKFALDVPAPYSQSIYRKLWGMKILPRIHKLNGTHSIIVNSKVNLNKAYQVYSDMLKQEKEKVPSLASISRKL